MENLINRVIDPVKMSSGSGAVQWIAAWMLQNAELFLCRNGYSIKIQMPPATQNLEGFLCHASGNCSGSEVKKLIPVSLPHGF